jgi:hypothetical protein
MLSLVIWLQNTPIFIFLRDWPSAYPLLLSLHLPFIAIFSTTIVLTDFRLLGWGMRRQSVSDIVKRLRVPKRIGFVLVATCGFLVFGMKAEEYYYNDFFRIKLFLFGMVALHAVVFRGSVYNRADELDRLTQTPARAKVAAGLSLLLWLCIVCVGRGIGYQPRRFPTHFAGLVRIQTSNSRLCVNGTQIVDLNGTRSTPSD